MIKDTIIKYMPVGSALQGENEIKAKTIGELGNNNSVYIFNGFYWTCGKIVDTGIKSAYRKLRVLLMGKQVIIPLSTECAQIKINEDNELSIESVTDLKIGDVLPYINPNHIDGYTSSLYGYAYKSAEIIGIEDIDDMENLYRIECNSESKLLMLDSGIITGVDLDLNSIERNE